MIKYVTMGDFISSKNPDTILCTHGIGSCLALALYEKNTRAGVLIHSMLPTYSGNKNVSSFLKYVDSSIYIALSHMYSICSDRDIVCKMVGGARLYKDDNDIGEENIKVARNILFKEKIQIESEDLRGDFGRSAFFELATGKILIKTIKAGEYYI